MIILVPHKDTDSILDSYLFTDKNIWLDSKWLFMVLWGHKNNIFSNKKEFLDILHIWETSYRRMIKELETWWYIERSEDRTEFWTILWYRIVLYPYPDIF